VARSLPEWCEVGVIARPHGVKGELRLELFDAEMALPDPPFPARVRVRGGAPREVTLTQVRTSGAAYLVRFAEVPDRNAAELLKGARFDLDRELVPAPSADEAYVYELVGATAVDEAGATLGVVRSVLQNPGHDLLAIDTPSGERLLPLAPELVLRFDRETRRVVVRVPSGLWED
jgi:16S rRNA processing protein RimM